MNFNSWSMEGNFSDTCEDCIYKKFHVKQICADVCVCLQAGLQICLLENQVVFLPAFVYVIARKYFQL